MPKPSMVSFSRGAYVAIREGAVTPDLPKADVMRILGADWIVSSAAMFLFGGDKWPADDTPIEERQLAATYKVGASNGGQVARLLKRDDAQERLRYFQRWLDDYPYASLKFYLDVLDVFSAKDLKKITPTRLGMWQTWVDNRVAVADLLIADKIERAWGKKNRGWYSSPRGINDTIAEWVAWQKAGELDLEQVEKLNWNHNAYRFVLNGGDFQFAYLYRGSLWPEITTQNKVSRNILLERYFNSRHPCVGSGAVNYIPTHEPDQENGLYILTQSNPVHPALEYYLSGKTLSEMIGHVMPTRLFSQYLQEEFGEGSNYPKGPVLSPVEWYLKKQGVDYSSLLVYPARNGFAHFVQSATWPVLQWLARKFNCTSLYVQRKEHLEDERVVEFRIIDLLDEIQDVDLINGINTDPEIAYGHARLRLAAQENAEIDQPFPEPPIEECTGIRYLRSAKDLIKEGLRMKHCVAGYARSCERGNCYIFHVSTPDGDSTIELVQSFDRFSVIQHEGVARSEPPSTNQALVRGWLKKQTQPLPAVV